MTPFELNLRHELNLEQHRFGNEWLFRWHNLNIEGSESSVTRTCADAEIAQLTEAYSALIHDGAANEHSSKSTKVANMGSANSNGTVDTSTFVNSAGTAFSAPLLQRSSVSITAEHLVLQLRNLVSEMPDLINDPITSETNRWLGRACMLVEMGGNLVNAATIKTACRYLLGANRSTNAQTVTTIVYETLAKAELNAQGTGVNATSSFSYRDVFVSHAREDKDTVARPLVQMLTARGVTVWFDEYELKLGDSLRRKIDQGLRESRHGLVIMSKNFFRKEWPQKELDALFALESRERRLLPVWHDLTEQEVKQYAPLISDRLAVSTSQGLDVVVDQIVVALSAKRSFQGAT